MRTLEKHYRIKLQIEKNKKCLEQNYISKLKSFYEHGIDFDAKSEIERLIQKGFSLDELKNIEQKVKESL